MRQASTLFPDESRDSIIKVEQSGKEFEGEGVVGRIAIDVHSIEELNLDVGLAIFSLSQDWTDLSSGMRQIFTGRNQIFFDNCKESLCIDVCCNIRLILRI